MDEIAWRIVRYLLFQGEAVLPEGGVKADPSFTSAFLSRRRVGSAGQSLRDLDLQTRLFKYRCSYMIYTKGFGAMPAEMKRRVLQALSMALRDEGAPSEFGYLPVGEKRAIRAILRESGILP